MAEPEPPPGELPEEKRQRKKAEKARDAWISFAGRVIAQVVGALASVLLGVYIVRQYQDRSPSASAGADPATNLTAAAPRTAIARRPGNAAIVVLPLTNLSGAPDQEYFADGLTEALTARLAQVKGLRVISRTSAMRYKADQPSAPEIARALGVDLIVEGSVLQAGDQVRITAQLIDGASDEHLWAESYTRRLKDILSLQDEVAAAIGDAIQGTVSRRPAMAAGGARPVAPAAYDLYLRGRHAWNQRTPEGLASAIEFFSRALAIDDAFALAHVGLADAYSMQGSPGRGLRDDAAPMAKAEALRALAVDPGLAEAHTALGGALFFGDRDFAGAEKAFRAAIAINPNYPVAREWLGVLLAELSRDAEAMEQVDAAVALSPLEGTMHQARGYVYYNANRFDEAARAERRALELTPQLPLARTLLVNALTLGGHADQAARECATYLGAATRDNVDLAVACAVAASRGGRATEAARLHGQISALRPANDAALAQLQGALGDYTEAFTRLDRLAAIGNLPANLAYDPLFEGLRAQPRWAALARQLAARDQRQ